MTADPLGEIENARALQSIHHELTNSFRAMMGLAPGTLTGTRATYPAGSVYLAFHASALALVALVGPDQPHVCAVCYLEWIDCPRDGDVSPSKCCTVGQSCMYPNHRSIPLNARVVTP